MNKKTFIYPEEIAKMQKVLGLNKTEFASLLKTSRNTLRHISAEGIYPQEDFFERNSLGANLTNLKILMRDPAFDAKKFRAFDPQIRIRMIFGLMGYMGSYINLPLEARPLMGEVVNSTIRPKQYHT